MITLGPVQSLAAAADSANVVNCFLEADTITPGATPPDLFGGRGPLLLGTTAQVLLAATAGQQVLVKSIALYSAASAPVVVAFYSNGTAAANQRYGLTLPAGGSAAYEDGRGWVVYDAGGVALSSVSVAAQAPLFLSGNTLGLSLGTGLALDGSSLALAPMAAATLKGNAGTAPAAPADLSVAQVQALLGVPATAYAAQPYAATLSLPGDRNLHARCTLAGDVTVAIPSSQADGAQLRLWFTASGASRSLGLAAGFVVPSSSALSFPVSIAAGAKARLLLEYDAVQNGGQWEVASFVNGY